MKAVFFATLLLAMPCMAQDTIQRDVVFSEVAPLASNAELARRMLTPLTSVRLAQALAKSGERLRDQPVTVADEKFVLAVPPTEPAGGYGLFVFVPPWKTAAIPKGWQAVLERAGVIYVSAGNSGNDASVASRRMPLALIAAANVMKRYHVDPAHVFVGGMSGGSRVALRLALAYPDVFQGALLNSGSDPIGDLLSPLPPRDLFAQFQERTRLVYVTGESDTANINTDMHSVSVVRRWCVLNVERRTMKGLGHETADPASLEWALEKLLAAPQPPGATLAACRAEQEQDMAARFAKLDALTGEPARALLDEIDRHFGGLAASRSVETEAKLAKSP